jgi:predicted lipoprotein with Yx(FWY)xxD motif
MHQTGSRPPGSRRRGRNLAVLALAAVLALSAVVVPTALARASKTVAGEATAPRLHKTVLTNTKGLTLYTLNGETRGKFICVTRTCLKAWPPLLVAPGTRPKGPVRLGTIRRPEGRIQVTYKGMPVYTYFGDSRKGEANGEGLRDVGVWHAVTP